jgi:CBS domain-containing protein
MRVGELCIREVVICHPHTNLVVAAKRMREHHVGSLVVVEADDHNEPVGMITDRDIVVDCVAVDPASITSRRVSDVMTCELVTAQDNEEVAAVLNRMKAFGVRRMPVLDSNNHLLGIIAYDDLIEWFAEQLADLTRIVRGEKRVEERRTATG